MKRTKYSMSVLGVAAALLAAGMLLQGPAVARSQDKLSARQIMEKVADNRQLEGSEAVMTMTIYNAKGQKRVRKIAMATKLYDDGKTEKKLSRFLSPPDVKGTGLLTFDYEVKDDDIWLFMPALRKTRRIVSSEKSKNFMGSEFSYADMNIPNLDDFKYKILKKEKAGGTDCWVVQSTPKNDDIADENGYSKQIVWVGQKDFTVRKGVYYDLDGEVLKELTASKIKLIDSKNKRYRPMKMEIVNKQNRRRTTMIFDKIEVNRDVKDEYFTTRYLERF
jgi:outer membrane lipoprotein-sorting protein